MFVSNTIPKFFIAYEKKIITVSGPSGSGKTVCMNNMLEKYNVLQRVVSSTSRSPRPRELEQSNAAYHFYSRADFEQAIADGKFIEFDEFAGNLYGTEIAALQHVLDQQKNPIVAVTLKGVEAIRSLYPDMLSVFFLPRSIEELQARIVRRDEGIIPAELYLSS